jgi:hypothetical protein
VDQNFGQLLATFEKLSKEMHRPIGENSPNLVTLLAKHRGGSMEVLTGRRRSADDAKEVYVR